MLGGSSTLRIRGDPGLRIVNLLSKSEVLLPSLTHLTLPHHISYPNRSLGSLCLLLETSPLAVTAGALKSYILLDSK